jgi:hypothetical protein
VSLVASEVFLYDPYTGQITLYSCIITGPKLATLWVQKKQFHFNDLG